MNKEETKLFKSICKYCINKYQILNSGPIISSFIYQLCKEMDMDVPSVQGIINFEVNRYKRQFAHCFNVYNGSIIDATIFQFALINKTISDLSPLYVVGTTPDYIDYLIYNEFKRDFQMKFNKDYLDKSIYDIKNDIYPVVTKFDLLEDSKKENLFYHK